VASRSRFASPAEVAAAAGVDDLFVLRRIAQGRFAHVGGVGRGGGWAGIVEVDESELPPADRPLVHCGTQEPCHVFGPYWARWALTVRLSDDVVVVFGGDRPEETLSLEEYAALAEYAAGRLSEVAASKRLADELEVLTAVQGLLRQPPESTPELLAHLADHATRALSCELGLVFLAEQQLFALCDLRPGAPLEDDAVLAAARTLASRTGSFPSCVQRASGDDLPSPFSSADGIHSYYVLELKPPATGILLLMHTNASPPRGFTSLCQTLGLQVVEAAQPLLAASLMRDQMQHSLDRAQAEARRDSLTGLANRLAWDEACANAPDDAPIGVIIIDAARLKAVNETYGYHYGDDLLRQIATLLRECVRETDTLARLGGDEFAILLHGGTEQHAQAVVERIKARVSEATLPDRTSVQVACGWTIERDGDLAAAQQRADAAMLTEKRERRAA
jgi:diguanylate cyclase (GGDEF)-like protein